MSALANILAGKTEAQLKRLSNRAGIDVDRIRQLVAGDDPSLAELRLLASALGVQFEDLLPSVGREAQVELLFRRSMGPDSKLPISAGRLARRMTSSLDLLAAKSK